VAQDKRNVFLCTEVGNPIPGEDTLHGNDNVFAVGSNGLQKYIRVRFDVTVQNDFSLCVENTEVHTLGVEINSTEKFVLLGVKSHTRPPFEKFFRLIYDTALQYQGGLNEYQNNPADLVNSAADFFVVEGASRLDNAADEEYPLIVRRKAPHNQRLEQTPFGRSSSAALGRNKYKKVIIREDKIFTSCQKKGETL